MRQKRLTILADNEESLKEETEKLTQKEEEDSDDNEEALTN